MKPYKIIFSNTAYVQICTEVQDYPLVETGGILIGRRIKDVFYVFESTDSGWDSNHTPVEFKRDYRYTERLAYKKANIYIGATVVGYWHRHPGNMNVFSSGDKVSNQGFAVQFDGVISGLVTISPKFTMTYYYIYPDGSEVRVHDISVREIPSHIMQLKDANEVIREIEWEESPHVQSAANTTAVVLTEEERFISIVSDDLAAMEGHGYAISLSIVAQKKNTRFRFYYVNLKKNDATHSMQYMFKYNLRTNKVFYELEDGTNSGVFGRRLDKYQPSKKGVPGNLLKNFLASKAPTVTNN